LFLILEPQCESLDNCEGHPSRERLGGQRLDHTRTAWHVIASTCAATVSDVQEKEQMRASKKAGAETAVSADPEGAALGKVPLFEPYDFPGRPLQRNQSPFW
jgi:hypothetical protein